MTPVAFQSLLINSSTCIKRLYAQNKKRAKKNKRERPARRCSPSNNSHAMHTPNTSSFQKPKAHYIQLEDLQKKNLEKRKQKLVKPTRTTLFLYSLTPSGSKAGIGMFSG
jgi:hypothetical protein